MMNLEVICMRFLKFYQLSLIIVNIKTPLLLAKLTRRAKTRPLIDTPAFGCQQNFDGFCGGRGFGDGVGGRMGAYAVRRLVDLSTKGLCFTAEPDDGNHIYGCMVS